MIWFCNLNGFFIEAYLGEAHRYFCRHILASIELFEIALVIEFKNKVLKRDDVCFDNF